MNTGSADIAEYDAIAAVVQHYIDGGFTNNMITLDNSPHKRTITVSPFSGESDICPADDDSASMWGILVTLYIYSHAQRFQVSNTSFRFTARNFYRMTVALMPPSPEVLSKMCQQVLFRKISLHF